MEIKWQLGRNPRAGFRELLLLGPYFCAGKQLRGVTNAFVTKIDPRGSALIYSTYLGGNDSDDGSGIAVDASGDAYLTGTTFSTNFPTVNALQPTLRGRVNAFITKINASGSALVYSTYLGGVRTVALSAVVSRWMPPGMRT